MVLYQAARGSEEKGESGECPGPGAELENGVWDGMVLRGGAEDCPVLQGPRGLVYGHQTDRRTDGCTKALRAALLQN